MNEEGRTLRQELELADVNLGFLLLIVAAVLISVWATVRQRDALRLAVCGETELAARVGEVAGLRLGSSALVIGALGFYFMQAVQACEEPGDAAADRSAWLNLIASFLVLLAALIRLLNLNMVRRAQPALGEDLPPD